MAIAENTASIRNRLQSRRQRERAEAEAIREARKG